MTRRRYPILGRRKLRSADASISVSKPVYLRLEILEVDLGTSLRVRSRVRSRVQSQGQIQGPISGSDPSISDLNNIQYILVKRPYEPNTLDIS